MGAYPVKYGDREVLFKDYALESWVNAVRDYEEDTSDDELMDRIINGAPYIAEKLAELVGYAKED